MRLVRVGWGFVVWLVCWGVLVSGGVGAQSPTPADTNRISYDEVINGSLDADTYRALYLFRGRQGEIISIEMKAIDGDLDPYLVLLGPDGGGIAFSDDDGSGPTARIESLRLPVDGEYFLVATRFGHAQGATTGNYTLTVQRIGATTQSGATLQYGDDIVGQITPEQPQAVYVFFGQRGEVINLHMRRTSGNLDPLLDVANSQGQILRTGDDDPTASGTLNAGIINFTLPNTGYYIVVATRYGRESGTTQGSFLLSLTETPELLRGRSPSNAILLDYEDTAQGTIDGDTPQRFYVFEGVRGDVVSIQLERTGGNLIALVLLLDADLNELARAGGDAFQPTVARINAATLPADGRYFIMATRRDFAEGETGGDFTLTLDGRAGLTSVYTEIFYNTATAGYISTVLPYESFVFQGEVDDIINVRMGVVSGDLAPLLTLYYQGKQLAFDDDPNGDGTANIFGFRLPQDGVYRVEASRLNRENGTTEGEYELRLEAR